MEWSADSQWKRGCQQRQTGVAHNDHIAINSDMMWSVRSIMDGDRNTSGNLLHQEKEKTCCGSAKTTTKEIDQDTLGIESILELDEFGNIESNPASALFSIWFLQPELIASWNIEFQNILTHERETIRSPSPPNNQTQRYEIHIGNLLSNRTKCRFDGIV